MAKEELTPRETEVLLALIRGLSNKEIADARHICIYSGYLLTPSGTFLLRIFLLSQSSLPDILSYLVQLIDINTIQEIGMLEK